MVIFEYGYDDTDDDDELDDFYTSNDYDLDDDD